MKTIQQWLHVDQATARIVVTSLALALVLAQCSATDDAASKPVKPAPSLSAPVAPEPVTPIAERTGAHVREVWDDLKNAVRDFSAVSPAQTRPGTSRNAPQRPNPVAHRNPCVSVADAVVATAGQQTLSPQSLRRNLMNARTSLTSKLCGATAVAALAVPLAMGTATTAHAAGTVTPANGSYSWSTAYEESGGLREGVTFNVKRNKTAILSTVRGICVGDYGVLYTPSGKDAKVTITNAGFKKVQKVTGDGDTATVTVKVGWAKAKNAAGWIKVTGSYFGNTCAGEKVPFKLDYYPAS